MLFKQALAALCLASGIVAVPQGKSIIGYRTVSKSEADKMNAANGPVWDGLEYGGGKQLGPGVYTSVFPGAWQQLPGEWVCVIYADSGALDRVSKVWVPNKLARLNNLWWTTGSEIDDYIRLFPYNWNPKRTLKMAWVSGFGTLVQLLIPPELVPASGSMGWSAVCKEKIEELPDRVTINYDNWQNNIGGQRGPTDS